jgi:hypothetical protein
MAKQRKPESPTPSSPSAEPRPDLAEARLEFTSRLASFGLGEEQERILEDAPAPRPSGAWLAPPGCP